MKAVFLRVLEELHDKESALRAAIDDPLAAQGKQRFDVDPRTFADVPRSPFAYWVSPRLRELFSLLPLLEAEHRTAKIGPSTGDDSRYVRCWWELSPSAQRSEQEWPPFAKGGIYSPFYADLHLVIRWDPRRKTFFGFIGRPGRETERPNSLDFFFRPGLTWPLRTKSALSLRAMPAGCVFGHKGPAVLVEDDDDEHLLSLLAIGCSRAFSTLVEFQLAAADARAGGAARSYEAGVLQRTPVPSLDPAARTNLAKLARQAWSIKRSLDCRNETSHAFVLPALLQVSIGNLASRVAVWSVHVQAAETEFAGIEAELNDRCFALYEIDDADRRTATEGFGAGDSQEPSIAIADEPEEEEGGEVSSQGGSDADLVSLATELLSWSVGVAFGRFDIRLATGNRAAPKEPEPFEPLPMCSPATLATEGGTPATRPPNGYPIGFPVSGILIDDVGHVGDLGSCIREVFDQVFKLDADAWWAEVAAVVDPKGHSIRGWLTGRFFEHHFRRYSKSRRNAPIYWQIGTASGRYSIWLYAHRLTRDSFFQIQNEVVEPKLAHEVRALTRLVQAAGASPSASERRTIAAQEALVVELREMLDEVKRVAPLWAPDWQDGVVLTMAPLWRLVPQHTAWQRELRSKWEALCSGAFDWSHIAMHLWPDRVVARCATDRSIAIAHGLESAFWIEDKDKKWKPRATPTAPLDELVEARSSSAVKAALASLTEASTLKSSSTGSGRRARR